MAYHMLKRAIAKGCNDSYLHLIYACFSAAEPELGACIAIGRRKDDKDTAWNNPPSTPRYISLLGVLPMTTLCCFAASSLQCSITVICLIVIEDRLRSKSIYVF